MDKVALGEDFSEHRLFFYNTIVCLLARPRVIENRLIKIGRSPQNLDGHATIYLNAFR
jgi:hypothetical protein